MIESAHRRRSPWPPGAITFPLILADSLTAGHTSSVGQEAPQLVEQVMAAVDHGLHSNEAVDHPLVLGQAHRHTSLPQTLGISDSFVTQRVELAYDYQRGRHAGQRFGA